MAAIGNYEVISGSMPLVYQVPTEVQIPAGKKILSISYRGYYGVTYYPNSDGTAAVFTATNWTLPNIDYDIVVAEMGC